jgi:hypothetical protein
MDSSHTTETIRVFLVDDHTVVRRGMRAFFSMLDDIEVLGERPTAGRPSTSWRYSPPTTTCPMSSSWTC